MERMVFRQTPEDWHGNFRIEDAAAFAHKDFVCIETVKLQPCSDRPAGWRVLVTGNDDHGMEKDFFGDDAPDRARRSFVMLTCGEYIPKDALADMGYTHI